MKRAIDAAIKAGLTPKQFVRVCEQVADDIAKLVTATPAVHAVKPVTGVMEEDEPTRQAVKVVQTLWPDMSDRETISTDWGSKTPQGLAASIDAIAELPKLLRDRDALLAALKLLQKRMRDGYADHQANWTELDSDAYEAASAAIAQAEQEQP